MRFPLLIPVAAGMTATTLAQAPGEQPFRLFFDWSKPELTRDAETILDEVVADYRRAKPGRVDVAGHSDRSGPERVNVLASRRRAEAVRSYLVARGIPAGAITVAAHGESRPIVPTEDGVREAQNRRVEIRFSGAR